MSNCQTPLNPNHIHPKISTPQTMNTSQPWQVRTQRKSMINKRKEKKEELAKDKT